MNSWSKPSCSPLSVDQATGEVGAAVHVDAHVHVFPPEMIRDRERYLARDRRFHELYLSPRAAMATAEQVVAHMAETYIDLAVLVGFPFADLGLCRLVNDYLIEAIRAHPDRLAGLACVPADSPGALAELDRCLDAGLVGCGELAPETCDSALIRIGRALAERDKPLLVHANESVGHRYPGKGAFGLEACAALAEACPDTRIVLAHMGGGLFLYELMPEMRRTLARVFYDTAAVPYLYDSTIYSVAVACVGPEKLVFGSDYPLLSPNRYQGGLDTLTAEARAAVAGGNACRVYGLAPRGAGRSGP